jgi:hypothetical protein
MDEQNQHAVLAPFGKHPVLGKRVQLHQDPFERHSERFLNTTTLPPIQKLGMSLYTNESRCYWLFATSVGKHVAGDRGKVHVKSLVKSIVALEKHHKTTDEEGQPFFFPWKSSQWTEASSNNLVKKWNSIDSDFPLIGDHVSTAQQYFLPSSGH